MMDVAMLKPMAISALKKENLKCIVIRLTADENDVEVLKYAKDIIGIIKQISLIQNSNDNKINELKALSETYQSMVSEISKIARSKKKDENKLRDILNILE